MDSKSIRQVREAANIRGRRKKSSSPRPLVSKSFPWKTMGFIAKDLATQMTASCAIAELKLFSQLVRAKDVKNYIYMCKNRWALKSMQSLASALRNEGLAGNEVLYHLRMIRLLTCFQKYPFQDESLNPTTRAFRTFLTYEQLCSKTNSDPIFKVFDQEEDSNELNTYDNLVTCNVLRFAKERILQVLGVTPDLRAFNAHLRHGPGATADKRGQNSIPILKWIPPFGCTKSAEKFFLDVINTDQRWLRSIAETWENHYLEYHEVAPQNHVKRITSSSLCFVPKTAETDRVITIEPTANMYLQLGIDFLIRKSLKAFGIDINTQEKNQLLAKKSSLDDTLVTLDLSSASDSIALVWLDLFPPRWRELLLALRTHYTTYETSDVRFSNHPLQKLSAMGNGYTFAVETLIFYALLYGVYKVENESLKDDLDSIAIYGDDIIFPVRHYSVYSYVLHRLGFRENIEKTFSHGPIRESCGQDFFLGKRIDRFTIKSVPLYYYEICILHNSFFSLSEDYGFDLPFTLKYFTSMDPKKNYGPRIEDTCSWYFTNNLPRKSFDRDTQTLYIKTKRFVISHPTLYKVSETSVEKNFIPLMYLNRYHECDFPSHNEFGRFLDTGQAIAYLQKKFEKSYADSYLFFKAKKRVRLTHAKVHI